MDTTEPDYLDAVQLEAKTGTVASTWLYWASIGKGPRSFKIGRRRVWARRDFEEWLEAQRAAAE